MEDQSSKRCLRNADGTGVLIGVSKVGSVQGYYMMDGERVPMPGKLYYRGISVEDIVAAHRRNGTFGYEEVAYLLLLGSLPTQAQQQRFNDVMARARSMPSGFTEDMILKAPSRNSVNQLARSVLALYSYDDRADDTALDAYLDRILDGEAGDRSGKIYGLGHAVYTMSDPRAVVIKKYAASLASAKGRLPDLELMERVEARGIEKIMTRKRQTIPMCANVDLYSGLIYSMLDIPEDLYTPLFATARIAGWCAHRLEELATGNRIMRPAYRAMLIKEPYIPVDART